MAGSWDGPAPHFVHSRPFCFPGFERDLKVKSLLKLLILNPARATHCILLTIVYGYMQSVWQGDKYILIDKHIMDDNSTDKKRQTSMCGCVCGCV